jgi:hypothetical protein
LEFKVRLGEHHLQQNDIIQVLQQVDRCNKEVSHSTRNSQLQHAEHNIQHEPPPYICVENIFQHGGLPSSIIPFYLDEEAFNKEVMSWPRFKHNPHKLGMNYFLPAELLKKIG